MDKAENIGETERRSNNIQTNDIDYDKPLDQRKLSDQEIKEEQVRLESIKAINLEISIHKEKILELTWELKILIKYTASEIIQHIQDDVKEKCENCFQMNAEKIEKEKELTAVKNKVIILEAKNLELAEAANVDKLTGLKNRRAFEEDLEKYIQENDTFSVAIIDLDFFKKINDTYWHLIWDQVLKFVSSKLKFLWSAYRWWGEEFLVLHKWSEKDLIQKIDMIRDRIANHKLFLRNSKNNKTIPDKHFCVSFTAWVMAFPKAMNDRHFLDTVDSVMYYAKNKLWRNIVIWHQSVKNKLPQPWESNFVNNNVQLKLLANWNNENTSQDSSKISK
jgi:diguanylate cyclase (GGDEF)-like protein